MMRPRPPLSNIKREKRRISGRKRRLDVGHTTAAEPWSDSLTANPGQRLTVPDSLTALTALSLTV